MCGKGRGSTGPPFAGALLPDLDTPSSTVARAAGPLSRLAARLTAAASGGHRGGLHSLFAVATFALLAVPPLVSPRSAAIAVGVAGWLLARMPTRGRSRPSLLTAIGVGFATTVAFGGTIDPDQAAWWTVALPLGAASHVLADAFTPRGVPLLWPASRTKVGVGLATTGGVAEMVVGLAAATWLLWVAARPLIT